MTLAKPSQTLPPHYEEAVSASILKLKAKRDKMNDSLISSKKMRRMLSDYFGIDTNRLSRKLTKYVTTELERLGIIEFWDETQHAKTTSRIFSINIVVLDAHEK